MSHLLLPNSIFALPTNKIEKLISTRLHLVCLKHLLFLFLTSLKGIFLILIPAVVTKCLDESFEGL